MIYLFCILDNFDSSNKVLIMVKRGCFNLLLFFFPFIFLGIFVTSLKLSSLFDLPIVKSVVQS